MKCKQKKKPNAVGKNDDITFRLRHTMRWRLMLFVLAIFLMSCVLTAIFSTIVFAVFGYIPFISFLRLNSVLLVGVLLFVCAVISAPLSVLFGRYYLRPVQTLIAATKEVKKGNFDVKVPIEADGKLHTEMDVLFENFNEMVNELGGIELFRNDFINSFSHEFKTPIVSIRGFAKELQYGDLTDDQRQEYAKIIAEESDRLAKLSISVLELSKLEHQQIITDKTEFWLDEQLRQCIVLQEPSWSEKKIDMIPELEEVKFFGNEEMLAHVWQNLIGNAIKFTPDGGIITVRLTADDRFATVSVADTGIGMDEETQRHIFEKFYQGDKSHARSGYGIGLAIVGRVVNLCNGTVEVQSSLGEGSVFTVRLPVKV